jgi:RNA polymerase sigma factor (sigma-70 family)
VADAPERAHAEPPDSDGELWQLLRTLPPAQRTVLALRYYLDMSEAQIAATLGCSVGTVKSNSSRAIAKLRAALSDAHPEKVTP